MSNEKNRYQKFNFDEYARSCSPDDFLGQTRRTVNGVPVSDEQIKLILNAIRSALDLKPNDTLLDIACGNGALSHYLFDSCAGYCGVDLSEYLISVAKKNFEVLPNYRFVQRGAAEYVRLEPQPEQFTKVLCYGSFQYFPGEDAAEVLRSLFEKFKSVQTVFLGNLPDRERAEDFYKKGLPTDEELLDCCSQMGTWRTRNELAELAGNAGWKVKVSTMPSEFHASHYRLDALLSRE
ncbi:MAG: class I SAM-dependent methyltransferase [Burkholderiales bacterium]|nr:class I SAM-dependent methyltransferase [Burkholderiales bacterium]